MYDSEDTFIQLLKRFMNKNTIAGVQPKTIAIVTDKVQLDSKDYTIKTWGQEFPYLAENEYFSMRALQRAGVVSVRALDKILMALEYELSLQPRNIVGLPPLQDD